MGQDGLCPATSLAAHSGITGQQEARRHKGNEEIPMNFYLSSQLAAARQTSMLDDARKQRLIRQSRMARQSARGTRPPRPGRPLRLAVRIIRRLPA
jgi:hypothetical protein